MVLVFFKEYAFVCIVLRGGGVVVFVVGQWWGWQVVD